MALSIQYWLNYTKDRVKLQRRSENSVNSGRVLKFVFDPETSTVNSAVQAKDKCYKVQVGLGQGFDITFAKCECVLRDYYYHHVAASLLYGYKNVSKTDVPCFWIKNPKSAAPKTTQTMRQLYSPTKPMYRALKDPVTQADRDSLYSRLSKLGRYTALHWILAPEPPQEEPLVPFIEDLLLSEEYLNAENQQTYLRKALLVSQQLSAHVAHLTSEQRECRAARRTTLPVSLKTRLLSAYNLQRVTAINWGIIHEEEAVSVYKALGASVNKTGQPSSLSLKTNHNYYHQIQGQLYLAHKPCCDLLIWTPSDFVVIRIYKEPAWGPNLAKLIDFYFNKFLPSLSD